MLYPAHHHHHHQHQPHQPQRRCQLRGKRRVGAQSRQEGAAQPLFSLSPTRISTVRVGFFNLIPAEWTELPRSSHESVLHAGFSTDARKNQVLVHVEMYSRWLSKRGALNFSVSSPYPKRINPACGRTRAGRVRKDSTHRCHQNNANFNTDACQKAATRGGQRAL